MPEGYRLLRQPDNDARISAVFEWTPTFTKVPIPKGGDTIWFPRFHTIKADVSSASSNGEPLLAASWRADFPLTAKDKGALRQLYLFITWTEDPAE